MTFSKLARLSAAATLALTLGIGLSAAPTFIGNDGAAFARGGGGGGGGGDGGGGGGGPGGNGGGNQNDPIAVMITTIPSTQNQVPGSTIPRRPRTNVETTGNIEVCPYSSFYGIRCDVSGARR